MVARVWTQPSLGPPLVTFMGGTVGGASIGIWGYNSILNFFWGKYMLYIYSVYICIYVIDFYTINDIYDYV